MRMVDARCETSRYIYALSGKPRRTRDRSMTTVVSCAAGRNIDEILNLTAQILQTLNIFTIPDLTQFGFVEFRVSTRSFVSYTVTLRISRNVERVNGMPPSFHHSRNEYDIFLLITVATRTLHSVFLVSDASRRPALSLT